MADRELLLLLGDSIAGTVTRGSGRLRFAYDPDYAGDPQATPVSMSMPLQIAEHSDKVVSPWLWGLLPDNDAVLNRWARDFHVSAQSPFSMLATSLGEDCPGAVRLVTPDRVDELLEASRKPKPIEAEGEVEWLSESGVAQRLRDLIEDQTAWLGARDNGRFSLAGAQAKTALLKLGSRWGDPHGAQATTHILKPAIAGFDDHDLNEHLCLSAMRSLGLPAVKSTLERFGSTSAIVVARYDRVLLNGSQVRVHQEDMCQALGVHPSQKYQNEGGPGPREITAMLRRAMPASAANLAIRTFTDALVWNWVIAGTDAHAKNYSLLLSGSQVRLAPLYDVASALPYKQIAEHKRRLAMKFGGSYKLDPVGSPWRKLAVEVGMSEDEVRERARRIVESAPDAFGQAAADSRVLALDSDLPSRMTTLVRDRASKCLRVLDWATTS